ncbi:hypothetical protein MXMO3_01702 [Maritalea myrionectae]|uniref:Uncharacterized protein n=1 Tax=Maritalea myrionectae TaxID=454601 RepID=A0A2R4MDW2_9HYPH|nr:terminase family protein [Maritalea myrionectae]AVX04228.1 hypothetical protein MXMO3_01702 [Maritalea myrionectae]
MNQTLDLSQIEAVIASLTDEQKSELRTLVKPELEKPFIATPGPQLNALMSEADLILYGGAAGGGKTALEVGAFFLGHQDGIIFRREATQLDGIISFVKELGEGSLGRWVGGSESVFKFDDGRTLKAAGLNQTDDWRKHAGRGRDYMAFDEAAEFEKEQIFSLLGWLRSTKEGQRCRAILGSNPPRGGDGGWMIEEFAPWLDPMFDDPAEPGELRWAIVVGGETEWVDAAGEYERNGEAYTALSRTFIPSLLDDNPYLKDSGYKARLQSLPEPLRSQLLYGDFMAGQKDHDWQVIPSRWIEEAQERWHNRSIVGREMVAISADIAMGGADNLVIGSIFDDYTIPEMTIIKGIDVTSPSEIAKHIVRNRRDSADVSVDYTGGWGSGVKSHLEQDQGIDCFGIVYSKKSLASAINGGLGFINIRAQMYWQLREALDPESKTHVPIALPPSARLKAELAAIRYKITGDKIQIESKDEVKKRLGRSTDESDVLAMLLHRFGQAQRNKVTAHRGSVKVNLGHASRKKRRR